MPAVAAAIIAVTIGSFLNLMLPKLSDAFHGDVMLDVNSISKDMKFILAYFKDLFQSPVPTTEVTKLLLEEMTLLAYDIEDTTDCFMTNFLPRDRGNEAAVSTSCGWRWAMRMTKPTRRLIEEKIRQLKKRSADTKQKFETHAAEKKKKKKKEKMIMAPTEEVQNQVISKADQLLDLLLHNPRLIESEKKLKVISIIGYGTLGNTLLIDKVYNTNEVENRFPRHTRIDATDKVVGQVIEEIDAQVNLNQSGGSTSNMGTAVAEDQDSQSTPIKDPKGKAIMEHQDSRSSPIKDLKGKAVMKHQMTQITPLAVPSESSQKDERYLIVIDNVNMDYLMAIIAHCLHENYAIVMVATTDYAEDIHCLCEGSPALDKGADEKYLNIQVLTDIVSAQEIINRKKGLRDELVRNYKESLSSFNLASCVLYFCMFPRHHLVRWNHLIMRYGAEGIDIHEEDDELRTRLDFLKIFINHHAVQVKRNGEVRGCQLPVMMLDQISSESKSEKFLTLFCRSTPTTCDGLYPEEYSPVRRISVHPISDKDATLTLPDASALPHLRTLAVFHTGSIDQIEKLPEYELLRVLDLKTCTVLTNAHLKKICDLLLLKYLSLGDSINEVPRKIAKLKLLETLNMTKTQKVHVPVEVIELPQITHLLGKFQLYGKDITPKKMKKLLGKKRKKSKLERLSGFVIGDSKEFLDLMRFMVNLKKVKIWCGAGKWTNQVTIAIKDFIRKNPKEGSLSIVCPDNRFVECLQGEGALASLKLCGDLRPFLDFLQFRLTAIQVLCLSDSNMSGEEIVLVLKHFLNLKYLKLVEHKIERLNIPAGCLHILEQLCLVGVDTLHEIQIQAGALLRLASLHMLFTETELQEGPRKPNLSGINIKNLPSLTEIALYSDVARDIKEEWQGQASDHKKKPKVLFIQRPN